MANHTETHTALSRLMRKWTLASRGLGSFKRACEATQNGYRLRLPIIPYIVWANSEGSGASHLLQDTLPLDMDEIKNRT